MGARKCKNIRDNIFVLGLIVNSVLNGNEDPIPVQVGDVEKCFDKLWLQKTTNDLFEAGLKNYKLNLLFLENRNAIKVNNKVTRKINIRDTEMQDYNSGLDYCSASGNLNTAYRRTLNFSKYELLLTVSIYRSSIQEIR